MYFENMQSAITRIFTSSVPKSDSFVKRNKKAAALYHTGQPQMRDLTLLDKTFVYRCAGQLNICIRINILINKGEQII